VNRRAGRFFWNTDIRLLANSSCSRRRARRVPKKAAGAPILFLWLEGKAGCGFFVKIDGIGIME
jgi:hypothetical protein